MVATALLAASLLGPSTSPEPSPVLSGLEHWLSGTRTLEAEFEQTLVSGALGAGTTESGRLYVDRPGHLRWDYTRPESKIALLVGDRTMLYIAEDHQLIRGTLAPEQSILPGLLAGTEPIARAFDATVLEPDSAGAPPRVRLVPRGRPDGFSEVVLTLSPDDYRIEAAEVLDAAGNRTVYRFRGLRRNRGLPAGLFAFEPPPGTEVTDGP